MIKDQLHHDIREALRAAYPELTQAIAEARWVDLIRIERPRNADFGDYAVNVSPLAKIFKLPPPQIAQILTERLAIAAYEALPVGGFLNFKLSDAVFLQSLVDLLKSPVPGKNNSLAEMSVLLEYVSANPTGPLHIGHGRWAALGNAIQRILQHCGASVWAEFYINDAGVQMANIARSLWYRLNYLELPLPQEGRPYPFYPGDYVVELAETLRRDHADELAGCLEPTQCPFDSQTPEAMDAVNRLQHLARQLLLAEQQALLGRMRVRFDRWYSEREELHERNRVALTLDALRERGFAYEQDGAVWFKSSALGDEKDRVLKKSDGSYTYLTADIAYHDDKFNRRHPDGRVQFNRYLNIWGADHHGYIARMKAAVAALGHDPDQLEILLGQLVNLIVDGEKTRMGKRRRMLTLQDVVDEVGVDATRFWMVSKSADTALDFDVDLAASATNENPVFYVQYAHARCCSILRNAFGENPDIATGQSTPPLVSEPAFQQWCEGLDASDLPKLFTALADEKARQTLKQLLIRLDEFEAVVMDAARLRAPHLIARYLLDISADFHSFYNQCRILTPDVALTQPRLVLVLALRRVLAQGLDLLGVDAPDQM